jgi:hypothetical protein
VRSVDYLRRRIHLSENAVMVGGRIEMGTLKTGKARTVALPAFVSDALAETARGKGPDELLLSTAADTPLGPPSPSSSLVVVRGAALPRRRPRISGGVGARAAAHGREPGDQLRG